MISGDNFYCLVDCGGMPAEISDALYGCNELAVERPMALLEAAYTNKFIDFTCILPVRCITDVMGA